MRSLRRRLARMLGARQPLMQVGAICLDPATGAVLMITSRGTGRWIIPKGWPMAGRTLAQAALIEAWEEAGVRADFAEEIGRFAYEKDQDRGFSVPIEVRVFLVRVDGLADDYPERHSRTRRWIMPQEAADLVAEPKLAALLRSLPGSPQPQPSAPAQA
jgi:8-oxo-dGTP pyrophosphatase MutT (NUDIX family)